ncbi:MAG TPA: sporulation protein YqfD [Ruminiclostridium sp.]|nr:sporulation protein YqfD [Ruminiclostridium sp.]
MFFVRLIQMFLGYINFRADGARLEKFLNFTAKSRVVLWNIRRSGTAIYASALASKYKVIEEQAKKAGVQITVLKKKGLPVYIRRLKKRLGFVIGIAIFAAVIFYFSGYVWTVNVSGNSTVSTREILYTLSDLGLSPGVRKSTFDKKAVEQQAVMKIPELSWLHINLDGSVAKVEVGERSNRPEVVPDDRPCNIKALQTGQIINIEVYEGQSVFKVGDTVQKNELIVSGVIEEPKTTVTRYVHARAKVIAATNRQLSVKVPFKTTAVKDTGKSIKKYSLNFLNVSIPFYYGVPKGNYRRLVYKNPLVIGGTALPISFNTTDFEEYKNVPVTLTKQQAVQKAQSILASKEKAEMSGINVKSKSYAQKFDGNSVEITGNYKCEENIAVSNEVKIGDPGGSRIIGEEGR